MTNKKLPMLASLKKTLKKEGIVERFVGMLGEDEAKVFTASIINITSGSTHLQKCTEESIMMAAFKSAALKLPIDPALGRAYLVPYGNTATFQLGYKGLRELAIRSGVYKKIRTVDIYADELEAYNPITGEISFTDMSTWKEREDPKKEPVGYYAFFEMKTGFEANVYMSKKEIEKHAKQYSQAYKANKKDSPWFTAFSKMARKTVLKQLLNDNGILSIEMRTGLISDQEEDSGVINNVPDPEVEKTPEAPKASKKNEAPVVDAETEPVEKQDAEKKVEKPKTEEPEATQEGDDPF